MTCTSTYTARKNECHGVIYVYVWLIGCDAEAVLYLCVSVSRLHERWLKDCAFYRDLYKQMNEIGLQPRINWIQVFNQKQVSSNGETSDHVIAAISSQNRSILKAFQCRETFVTKR